MNMKKLLTVTMLSMSVCATSVGYTQSLYAGGGNYPEYAGLTTETDVGAENANVIKWIFRGIEFVTFILALQAAWKDLNAWLADGNGNREDPRAVGVCEFYHRYKNNHDLSAMKEILKENRLCSLCSKRKRNNP